MLKPDGSLTASDTLGMAKMNEMVAIKPMIPLMMTVQNIALGTERPAALVSSAICAAESEPAWDDQLLLLSSAEAAELTTEREHNCKLADHQ